MKKDSLSNLPHNRCKVCGYDFTHAPPIKRSLCLVCVRIVPPHIPLSQARRYVVKKHGVRFNKTGMMSKASVDRLVDIVLRWELKTNHEFPFVPLTFNIY